MMKTVGAILTGSSSRSRNPVRRMSSKIGHCEAWFWTSTTRQEVRRIVLAARRYDLAGRVPGRRNGPLGHIALELIDLLANLMDKRTGRLEPSLAWLMGKLRRSKDAVTRAMAALREHGFLDWLRRWVPVANAEGPGPRVKQTSNAYRLSMPARALRLLGVQHQPVPVPDDIDHEQAARAAEVTAYKASLPLDELAALEVHDNRLGHVLGSLGRKVQERESAKQAESNTTAFSKD
jgi:hypothetical protein